MFKEAGLIHPIYFSYHEPIYLEIAKFVNGTFFSLILILANDKLFLVHVFILLLLSFLHIFVGNCVSLSFIGSKLFCLFSDKRPYD